MKLQSVVLMMKVSERNLVPAAQFLFGTLRFHDTLGQEPVSLFYIESG